MATTVPDGIWSPDDSTAYNPPIDLAAMADTIQGALNDVRSEIAYEVGADAGRLSIPPGELFDGLRWYSSDTNLEWLYASGIWRVSGGLVPFADASVPAGTVPAAAWTSLALSGTGGRLISVGSGKLTVSVPGRYRIVAGATVTASISGQARIRKNGTETFRESISSVTGGAAYPEAMAEMNLSPGDYLEFQIVSNSGGTLFGGSVNMMLVPGA